MKALFLTLICAGLSACATRHAPFVRVTPYSVPGTTLPSQGIESVRYAENIKAYPLGRYIDPNNSGIMHEGHTIYRVETSPKWNLHPNAPTVVPMGPRVAVYDPSKKPGPVSDEVRAEITRQKDISRSMTEQTERLNQYLQNLRNS